MSIEILDGTRSELGEGPTYDPAQGKAWWFDIRGKSYSSTILPAGWRRFTNSR